MNSKVNSDIDSDSSSDDDFPIDDKLRPDPISLLGADKPVKQEYVYEIFKYLETDYTKLIGKFVNIVIYNINYDISLPFIQFLLVKVRDRLSFYNLKLRPQIKNDISILILQNENNIKIKGYTEHNKQYYLFVNITQRPLPSLLNRTQSHWHCIVDEIINYNKVCNFDIDTQVSSFLLSNPDYFLLKNPNTMNNYETPIVVYSGSHVHQVELDGIFGPSKKSELSLFGPHYYFTTYEKAVEMGGWSSNKSNEYKFGKLITESPNGKYIKGGINRYCFFCLNHKVINKPKTIYKMPINCDSLYIGKMQINENIYNDSPVWIAKKSTQFTSLSYHELDKKTLGDEWNKDSTQYFIS